ncbi:MAG TPA: TIGR02186 family protein [Bryobacteraceae bacterium]|nr:TIGR02186 family protein [Bryobacteraceae bacterium]
MNAISLLAGLLFAAGTSPSPAVFRITPQVIQVGAFYDGAQVSIEGASAPRSQVIVAITGPDRQERFKRKVRFGPVWVNAGRVRISGAPSLILRFSAGPIAALLDRQTIASLRLDESSLQARMHIDPPTDPAADAALRSSYLALKRSQGTYAFSDRGVSMGQPDEDCVPYSLHFHWPPKAPPAQYTVTVYEVRDGAIVMPLSVVRTGFPAWLASLAETRASLYGLTAVLIGALAGFGIDFLTTRLFGKKRAVAH